jgi:hypothetical protein
MKIQRQVVSAAFVFLLVTHVAFVPAAASVRKEKVEPAFRLAQLAGYWQIALYGNTGCGPNSLWFTGNLNANGQATNGELLSSSGCGVDTLSYQNFTITNWNNSGSGTATLSCGDGCGWQFSIEGTPEVMNLVDVADSANYLAGTAVKMGNTGEGKISPVLPAAGKDEGTKAGPAITVAQLAGTWQIGLIGNTGCGPTSLWFDGSIDKNGQGAGELYSNSGCGNDTESTQTITITGLYADGSGSASLSCGPDCGWNLLFQVSSNAEVITFVDVTDANNYLAGTATKVNFKGNLTVADLAGAWQITWVGNTGCGPNSLGYNVYINPNGEGNAPLYSNSGCGIDLSSYQYFTITSLQTYGAGTATLSCGDGCGWTFNIQVSPNGKDMTLADVSDLNNYLAGTAVQIYAPPAP